MLIPLLWTALLAISPTADDNAKEADPTRPSLVRLDFRAQPTALIAEAIGERSGNTVEFQALNDPTLNLPSMTLEAPEPLPFWEAIDRLRAATHLQYSLAGRLPFGKPRSPLTLHGPPDTRGEGPALYAGPFRLDRFALHANFDQDYVPKPSFIRPPGPFYAEFQVMVEPKIMAVRTGPIQRLEATDDKGQSLVVPKSTEFSREPEPFGYEFRPPALIPIPLSRLPEPGRALRVLRGVIPVEVGIPPTEPTLVIPLASSAGKTFKAGDMNILIEEYGLNEHGSPHFKILARIEGERGDADQVPKAALYARLMNILHSQLDLIDDKGESQVLAGGTNPEGGVLRMEYTFSSHPVAAKGVLPPTRLHVFAPRWVAWELPFEFRDLPLP
jgi:hypothetical protein